LRFEIRVTADEKIMRTVIISTVMLSVLFCGGCATLLRGTEQTLTFQTVPSGAEVFVDGTMYTSPVDVKLRRKAVHRVTIAKEGYRTLRFLIDPQWDGVSLVGNIILPGGSVGLVIDNANGADQNFFKLAKIELVPSTQPDEPPLVLNDFKGHLLTDWQLRQAVAADRLDRAQFFRGEP
jgi:hypothetical protein